MMAKLSKAKDLKEIEAELDLLLNQTKSPSKKNSKKKITTMLSNDLLNKITKHAKGKNITESLTSALEDWIRIQEINKLFERIKKNPLEFSSSAQEIRDLNRKFR